MSTVAERPDSTGIAIGAALTFFAHSAFVGLLVMANIFGDDDSADAPVIAPVISAELLMLGDVMPTEGELPWIANPEEAPEVDDNPDPAPVPETETAAPDQETVVLHPEPAPVERRREENRPNPEPSNRDLPERRDRGETNPNRPTNNRPRIGSPDGFAGGTSLSASAQANQFAGLVNQLSRALRRPAALTEEEYTRLRVDVNVRVTAEGRVVSWDFVNRSGNPAFDSAVESMLNRFRLGSERLRLSSISNEELREAVIRNGFQIPVRPGR
ncbi:MAG: TonB C-terminal domain-containing protein [Myxococcales bacterium]|nr:TonB C-terminal domain-containing protein [Myxococcales bacterium]MCB9531590.1 TonB C-terminal domain-containing protein [Myxococcales bacterium]MCB9532758.1 TonB C-terminal domain-containing protein [Myxococcales bacterium]